MVASPWDVYALGLVGVFGLLTLIDVGVAFLQLGRRVVSSESLDG